MYSQDAVRAQEGTAYNPIVEHIRIKCFYNNPAWQMSYNASSNHLYRVRTRRSQKDWPGRSKGSTVTFSQVWALVGRIFEAIFFQ